MAISDTGAGATPGDEPPPPVLLVTGLSGAGKSTALKVLEDLGYEAVDNLPLSLLAPLLAAPAGRLAIGIDARTRAFTPQLVTDAVAAHARLGQPIRIVYLDCAGHELVRRFSETRRRHPLAQDRPAGDGIALERELLSELRRVADVVIDTTDFSSNDLRRAIVTRFGRRDAKPLTLTIVSFGYARGVPRDADLVFDMRFLDNPHWVAELRPLTGTDPAVRAHVEADPAFAPAFSAITGLLTLLLPGYAREGRAYLTVAFGCTGGRHRSVAVAEAAGAALERAGWANAVVHRDRTQGPEEDAPAGPAPDGETRGQE
jgi:UPF0042 nucleotide-binding protein